MFVQIAARPRQNGDLYKEGSRLARTSHIRFFNQAEALAALDVMTHSVPFTDSYASRSYMQKGITGFRRYRNTPYEATFERSWSNGRNRMISEYKGAYQPFETIVSPLVFSDGRPSIDKISPQPHRLYFTGNQGWDPIGVANRVTIQNTINRAQVEARDRAADRKMDLSETLVDLDKSALMVADGTLRVLRALRSVRRGNLEAAMRYLGIDYRKPPKYKDIANAWLALQYGWMPLLNDIYDGSQALKVILDPVANPHQLHSTRRISQKLMMPDWEVQGQIRTLFNEAECSAETKLRFSVSDPFWALMGQLGLTNPASFAWAALPYSFVVDWLLPVGTMLGALSAPIGLKYQSGYTTVRSWGRVSIERTSLPKWGNVVFSDGLSRIEHQGAKIERIVHNSWPTVLPYVRLPFSNPTRMLNAAALIETSKRRG